VVALALAALALSGQVAFLRGNTLVQIDLATGAETVVAEHAAPPVAFSGDGKFVSWAGHVVGGPSFPTSRVTWGPTGETLAYVTKAGAAFVWDPTTGLRTVVPAGWGASSVAWGRNGKLAIGRKLATTRPRGLNEVWTWQAGRLERAVGPILHDTLPIVAGFAPDGRVLWWDDVFDSASIAADGLMLHAGKTALARTLVYPDYVQRCGRRLALAAGIDRYATRGKRILLGGHDVSKNLNLSWVSPSCSADGKTLVAAAGRNWTEPRIGSGERRSIWQLLPTRKRLTRPPAGWTDENPRVLADGSILFVRTKLPRTQIDVLSAGTVTTIADFKTSGLGASPYYGHYAWPWLLAVTG
jgi:hypothetical protein